MLRVVFLKAILVQVARTTIFLLILKENAGILAAAAFVLRDQRISARDPLLFLLIFA